MADLAEALALLERGDWQGAHPIVQEDDSTLGCWAHGIVHLLEGDVANAQYWYRRAQRPAVAPEAVAGELEALRRELGR